MPEIYCATIQRRKNFSWLLLALFVFVLDQLTKNYVMTAMQPYETWPVFSWLNVTLAYNTGAAFSLLSEAGGWQRYAFLIVGLVIVCILTAWLGRLQRGDQLTACGLSLIIGGALGNMWDRFFLGHVVDFIDVYYQAWHWPAFNVADSAICVGAILVAVFGLQRGPAL